MKSSDLSAVNSYGNREPIWLGFLSRIFAEPRASVEMLESRWTALCGTVYKILRDEKGRLCPQIPGLIENVGVFSIVGHFLEHARLYYFANDNHPEYLMGSADRMKRNLESCVAVFVPSIDGADQFRERSCLDVQLLDEEDGWEMMVDGRYARAGHWRKRSGLRGSSQDRLSCRS